MGADSGKGLKRHAENEHYVMDEAIYEINDFVFKSNIEKGLWAPDMASQVHRKINGINKSFYYHLATIFKKIGQRKC